jgi:hypothetical protein
MFWVGILANIAVLVCYEILDISLDLIEGYSPEVANSIDYLSYFRSEQVLIEENIDIYRYKEGVELAFIFIIKVWRFNYNTSLLYNNS